MNFRQLRIQHDTPKEITMPESKMVLWVKPITVLDLAIAGEVPAAMIQDMSDLEQEAKVIQQKNDTGNASISEIMDNAQKTADFSRQLIKQIVVEEQGTPKADSWHNDDNLKLIPHADLVWFRTVAMAGFTDDVLYPKETDEELETPTTDTGRIEVAPPMGADFPGSAAG